MADPNWLTDDEAAVWRPIAAMILLMPQCIEEGVQPHGLTWFEYSVLATLSHSSHGEMRTSELAGMARGSLSRTSHAARRLESRGLLQRGRCPEDGRVTMVVLTEAGRALLEAAAPDHVAAVRKAVFDPLTKRQLAELASIGDVLVEAIPADGGEG